MLSFFLDIMKQRCGSYVCVQLLQTLNILFENIRNETSLYYLLSNNHVNSIIVHRFDFSDEEVMAYYISFLKTLSFKLNPHTIHFFFNTNDFPLYTEAIKFFNHSEKMVRIAVRTLTLNVFRVEEKSMLKFITDQTAVPYFTNLIRFLGDHVINIEKCLKNGYLNDQQMLKLDDLFAEHLDHLHYLNDILLLKIEDLNLILYDYLMHRLLKPLVDGYTENSNSSMIRLFTLEFTTSSLQKILSTSLCCQDDDTDDVGKKSEDRLSKSQVELIDIAKQKAESNVRTLFHSGDQMTFVDIFENEYNEMRRKRLSIDYLLMDARLLLDLKDKNVSPKQPNPKQQSDNRTNLHQNSISPEATRYSPLTNVERARHTIRDFLLWRQLFLNIRNEEDTELPLDDTHWLSFVKLLKWVS